jgi:uncharacterized Zn-finger protein
MVWLAVYHTSIALTSEQNLFGKNVTQGFKYPNSCTMKFNIMIGLLEFQLFSVVSYRCLFEGCGKHYYSLNSLNSHSRSHQHKEEEVRCQWEGCGKLFDKPCRLKAHMRSHTGDKPYPCMYPVTLQFVLSVQTSL